MAKVSSKIFAFNDMFVAVPAESSENFKAIHASPDMPGDFDCFLYKGEIDIGFMDDACEAAYASGGLYEGGFWVAESGIGDMKFVANIAKAISLAEKTLKAMKARK